MTSILLLYKFDVFPTRNKLDVETLVIFDEGFSFLKLKVT
jgi:hypothetical protein